MNYEYQAELVRVIDGDTVVLRVKKSFDFGFRVMTEHSAEMSFRLAGINSPELHGVDAEEKERALAAKTELERLCGLGALRAVTSKPDKYGRWLVTLFVQFGMTETNVNESLLTNGFAVPYMV